VRQILIILGRTALGKWASTILLENIPTLVDNTLCYQSLNSQHLYQHILSSEDQEYLRNQLSKAGLVAFIRDGAILPRESGVSDKPMKGKDVVIFKSPPTLSKEFVLPNAGKVTGMGIPKGVTLIVGGGFHGKTTLLNAIEMGIYNHIPGDGREFVVTDRNAVKVRSEDGRSITGVDISPFIDNLPFNKSTKQFSTPDASGSTSQAANIMEALEVCVIQFQ
jgi:predicted ABC-class ATPase